MGKSLVTSVLPCSLMSLDFSFFSFFSFFVTFFLFYIFMCFKWFSIHRFSIIKLSKKSRKVEKGEFESGIKFCPLEWGMNLLFISFWYYCWVATVALQSTALAYRAVILFLFLYISYYGPVAAHLKQGISAYFSFCQNSIWFDQMYKHSFLE